MLKPVAGAVEGATKSYLRLAVGKIENNWIGIVEAAISSYLAIAIQWVVSGTECLWESADIEVHRCITYVYVFFMEWASLDFWWTSVVEYLCAALFYIIVKLFAVSAYKTQRLYSEQLIYGINLQFEPHLWSQTELKLK